MTNMLMGNPTSYVVGGQIRTGTSSTTSQRAPSSTRHAQQINTATAGPTTDYLESLHRVRDDLRRGVPTAEHFYRAASKNKQEIEQASMINYPAASNVLKTTNRISLFTTRTSLPATSNVDDFKRVSVLKENLQHKNVHRTAAFEDVKHEFHQLEGTVNNTSSKANSPDEQQDVVEEEAADENAESGKDGHGKESSKLRVEV